MRQNQSNIAFLLILLLWGCSPSPRPAYEPPIRHEQPPAAVPRELRHLPTALENKKIVLDPGHGGIFPGAVGEKGLTEAKVNLRVALRLGDRLSLNGANVILTRLRDTHFSEVLTSDLQYRCDLAEEHTADIFVSIHHNSLPQRLPEFNQTETYYRTTDEGPSRDLAASIHHHLLNTLKAPDGEVKAGNQYVLRNTSCPAVLGEALYLSNPEIETKLHSPKFIKKEADAYYNGIWEFFARRTPMIIDVSPADSAILYTSQPLISSWIVDGQQYADGIGKRGIDSETIRITINDREHPFHYDPTTERLTCRPNLKNGTYMLTISARNNAGNSTPTHRSKFTIQLPPENLYLSLIPNQIDSRFSIPIGVEAIINEPNRQVNFSVEGGTLTLTQSTTNEKGIAATTIIPDRNHQSITIKAVCDGLQETKRISTLNTDQRWVWGRVIETDTNKPIADADLQLEESETVYHSREDGYFTIPIIDTMDVLTVRARGFIPQRCSLRANRPSIEQNFQLTSMLGGIFHNRRVMVDAMIDPEQPTSKFSKVYRILEETGLSLHNLSGLYAEARGENKEKVKQSMEFKAEVYLMVTAENPKNTVSVFHYPGSRNGTRLAAALCGQLQALDLCDSCFVGETNLYMIAQTACPAVHLNLPAPQAEKYQKQVSQKILYALAEYFGVGEVETYELQGIIIDDLEQPVPNFAVEIDGVWQTQTDAEGFYSFPYLVPGVHLITVGDQPMGTVEIRKSSKKIDFRVYFE